MVVIFNVRHYDETPLFTPLLVSALFQTFLLIRYYYFYYYYRYIYIHIYIYINVETGSLNFLNFFFIEKKNTIDKVFHKITNLVWGYYCFVFFLFPIYVCV